VVGSVRLKLQSLIDTLGVIVVSVLDLVFSQGPQVHAQDEAATLSKAYILIVIPALGCRLHPVTLLQKEGVLGLVTKCCMIPPCRPATFGEFRAFGSAIGVRCVV